MKKLYIASMIGLGLWTNLWADPIRLITGSVDPKGTFELRENEEASQGKIFRIIQVDHFLNTAEMEKVLASGIELQQYVPEKSYFAWIPEGFDQQKLQSFQITGMIKLTPRLKIHPSFRELPYPNWLVFGNKIEVKVSLESRESIEKYVSMLQKNGFEVPRTYNFSHLAYVRLLPSELEKLAKLEFITFIEPTDGPVVLENLTGRTDHRSNTMAPEYITNRKYNGEGVVASLGDDGIIGPHIDYQGRVINHAVDTTSTINHAGHTSGIMMGGGNLDQSTRGMAWGMKLHVYDYYQALTTAPAMYVSDSVRLGSFSLGETCNAGYTANAVTADQMLRQFPKMMHVFSAGNSGGTNCNWGAGTAWGQITGGYKMGKNVFTVGNVTYVDAIAPSSSRGPASDGRLKPEICAVGTDVNSCLRNNQYQLMTGTSMACPAITGIFGQMIHAYKVLNNNQEPETALIKAAMMIGADDLGNKGPDFTYGYGRVNGNNAVKVLENNTYFTDTIVQNGERTFTLNIPNNVANAKILLYYLDRENTAGASLALVNDLTLKVTDANSNTYLPWALLKSGKTAASVAAPAVKGVDSLNNHEMVEIDTPTAGNYTISVQGTAVPQGPVTFYVVYQITYKDQLTLTYPFGGESLVPGTTETIRWDDATNNTNTYTLEYSTDGGINWTNIRSNIAATNRYYLWGIPSSVNTGNMYMRITRTGAGDTSNAPSAIYAQPTSIRVTRMCPDSMEVTWNGVNGATSYEVSLLGNKYMDSVGVVSGATKLVFPGTFVNNQTYWISVRAISPQAKGRRANAISKAPGFLNCAVANDISIIKLISPAVGTIPKCGSDYSDSIRVWVRNFSNTSKTNIPVNYQLNNNSIITETCAVNIAGMDSTLFTFSVPVTFSIAGTNKLNVWTSYPGDPIKTNDSTYSSLNIINSTGQTLGTIFNFDSGTRASSASTCGAVVSALPGGYYNETNNVSDDHDWRLFGGATPSTNTGPDVDHTTGTATGNYIYLEASTCTNKLASLITPCFTVPASGTYAFRYWYHMYGANMGTLQVDMFVDGRWINNITPLLSGDKGNIWKSNDINLNNYLGKTVAFRFKGTTGNGFASDMALDDMGMINTNPNSSSNIAQESVQLYPNPASEFVQISGVNEKDVYQIVDVTGKLIQIGKIYSKQIDIKMLPNGIYFLDIQTINGSFRKKLMIQRN